MQTRLFGLFYSDKTVGRPSTRGPRFGNFGCTPWGTMGKSREPQVMLKTDKRKIFLEVSLRKILSEFKAARIRTEFSLRAPNLGSRSRTAIGC
jgi:hypothetical protein